MASLLERVLKNSTIKGAARIDKSAFFGTRNVTTTQLPILNIAFSGEVDGGFPPGLTIIAGESKTYKTLLSLQCMKAFLDANPEGMALLYDSEYGITPAYLLSKGIDVERVLHVPVEDIEQLKFDMVKQVKDLTKKDKVFIMVDSIGNLASKKEVEDAAEEKSVADMSRAKAIKSLWRIVTPYLTRNDIPCFVINHIYMTLDRYASAVVSGGSGLMYSANQVFIISKAKQTVSATDKTITGFKFTINIEKSRFVKEKSKFPFTVLYDGDIQRWSSMFELATEMGLIRSVSTGWWQLVDPETGEVIEGKIREKMVLKQDDYFKKLVENTEFKEYVKHKYSLDGGPKEMSDRYDDGDDDDIEGDEE